MTETYGRMTKESVCGKTISVKGDRLCQTRPNRTIQVCTNMRGTFCDKRTASKWVLLPNSNRWQELDGSHQWKMAKTLFCLEKKVM